VKLIFKRIREKKGQLAAVLNLFLAVGAVMLIAGLCFEMSRYFLARDQLKTNTEAAALCCETALVSSGDPSNATNQTSAVSTALTLFQQNSILGSSMSNATVPGASTSTPGGVTSELTPGPGQAQICFQFLDPILRTPVAPGSTGTLIQATGAYCYTPAFLGHIVGLGSAQFSFQVSAFSGVPRIDVVLAFDVSGSQGEFTPVSPIQRYANTTTGGSGSNPGNTGGSGGNASTNSGGCTPSRGPQYMLVNGPSGSTFTGGYIADLIGHPGGGVTAIPSGIFPQHLEYAANFPGAPAFAGLSTSATANLPGYVTGSGPGWMNTPPGDYCICPNGSSTGVTYGYGDKANPNSHLQHPPAPKLIAFNKSSSDDDLRQLCGQLDSLSAGKKDKLKLDSNKSEERLSKISFAPLFEAFDAGENGSTTNTTNGANAIPVQYNGAYFFPSSHVPVSGAVQSTFSDPSAPAGQCNANGTPIPQSGINYQSYFTDLTANIDGNKVFWGNFVDQNSFLFVDPSTMAEASRYNLESTSNALSAFVDYSGMGVTPAPGYANAYFNDANYVVQPPDDLLMAANGLVNEMKNVADAHFSFIAFSDTAGNSTTALNPAQFSTSPQAGYVPMISSWFPYPAPVPGGSNSAIYVEPALPFVALDPNNTNNDLMNNLPNMYPNGNRNVAAVLTAAINQLTTNGRPGANKAIILFCSGVPTEANQSNSTALQDALTVLTNSGTQIPVYCVCIADPQTTPIASGNVSADDSADDSAYGSTAGITGTSSPGGGSGPKYYRVDYTGATAAQTNLSTVVDNIVRQMIGMMH